MSTFDYKLDDVVDIEVHYSSDPGEPGEFHDGNGLGRPEISPSVEIHSIYWVNGANEKEEVSEFLRALGYMDGIEDETHEYEHGR